MKKIEQIHPIQSSILRHLSFKSSGRFSDLNSEGIPTDQFNFHLKTLIEMGFVEKSEKTKIYKLTNPGKEFIGRFDTDTKNVNIEKQPKISVVVHCCKKFGRTKKYLLQQRLKEPFFGYFGSITGKVRWGELISNTAIRELKEETGLDAKRVRLLYVRHKMDYDKEQNLLDDKVFFVYEAIGVTGKLIEEFEGGKNYWLTLKEIGKLSKVFDGFDKTMKILKMKTMTIFENKYVAKGF